MGMGSLNRAVSGMNAAQMGLYVTGHNMANSEIRGFSRQRLLQSDAVSVTIGFDGNKPMQLGLGTNTNGISQARDRFLDMAYRQEVTRLGFHEVRQSVGREVETIMGELHNTYRAQSVMQDMWDSLQAMSIDPTALENRASFISSAIIFVNRVSNVSDRMQEEQQRLNNEITSMVGAVNNHVEAIRDLNIKIMNAESSGDKANDFRDLRNLYLDELSTMIDVNISTDLRTGMVQLSVGSNELLKGTSVNTLGLRYTSAEYNFVEPVFTNSTGILPYEPFSQLYQDTSTLFNLTGTVSASAGNDGGQLKSMLIERGMHPITYDGLPDHPEVPNLSNPFDPVTEEDLYDMANTIIQALNQRPVDDSFLTPASLPNTNLNVENPSQEWVDFFDNFEQRIMELEVLSAVTGIHIQVPSMPEKPAEDADSEEWTDYYNHLLNVTRPSLNRATQTAGGIFSDLSNALVQVPQEGDPNYNPESVDAAEAHNRVVMKEYNKQVFNATQTGIPAKQREFDTLINTLVTFINNTFSPTQQEHDGYVLSENAPYGLDSSQGTEIFVRKNLDRFDEEGFLIQEDPRNPNTLYSMSNIMVNPLFSDPSNYQSIPHSQSGDPSDTALILDILDGWKSGLVSMDGGEPMSVENFYRSMIMSTAMRTGEAESYADAQMAQVEHADSRRMQLSSVSLDEEMSNMLKFQHAYNASARIFNVIDSLLDTVINQM